MAGGWAPEGAVQAQIDDTVNDAVSQARERMRTGGQSLTHCIDCEAPIPERRRQLISGVRRCVACQAAEDAARGTGPGFNRRGSKDSQLR